MAVGGVSGGEQGREGGCNIRIKSENDIYKHESKVIDETQPKER